MHVDSTVEENEDSDLWFYIMMVSIAFLALTLIYMAWAFGLRRKRDLDIFIESKF